MLTCACISDVQALDVCWVAALLTERWWGMDAVLLQRALLFSGEKSTHSVLSRPLLLTGELHLLPPGSKLK